MSLSSKKIIAAKILKVGVGRVWMDPERIDDVALAIRRADIKRLIHEGIIKAKPQVGTSRARARELHEKRKKGQRKGPGSREGKKSALISKKEMWMQKIRPIRRYLRRLRVRRMITPRVYRDLYLKAKGGLFNNRRQLEAYIKNKKLLRR
ncbi:MAG: 50S ribosomal protein L19e [Promethearchaeota archaeon]